MTIRCEFIRMSWISAVIAKEREVLTQANKRWLCSHFAGVARACSPDNCPDRRWLCTIDHIRHIYFLVQGGTMFVALFQMAEPVSIQGIMVFPNEQRAACLIFRGKGTWGLYENRATVQANLIPSA